MNYRALFVVEYGSAEYKETVALRDEILRRPLGLSFTEEELAQERDYFHLACRQDGKLVACLMLVPIDESTVRMRQVAVFPTFQSRGIGRALTHFAEGFAAERGFNTITLHARETAVRFYEKLGYERVGESFEELSILHCEMRKTL